MSKLPGSVPPNKVAIPRLEKRLGSRPSYQSSASLPSNPNRVMKACLGCRTRKVRCNGAQPRCNICETSGRVCNYAPNRKDRLTRSTERSQAMALLLGNLKGHATEEQKIQIEEILSQVAEDASEAASSSKRRRSTDTDNPQSETLIYAGMGSNEVLDIVDESLLHYGGARAAGFVGKSSEIQWLRRLQEDADPLPRDLNNISVPRGPHGESSNAAWERVDGLREHQPSRPHTPTQISVSDFYLDNEKLDVDEKVDALELPTQVTAKRLVDTYMETVQDSFPILSKKTFLSQFHENYERITQGNTQDSPIRWLAALNLVLAIAARYSHLVEADWRADEHDHILYYNRAQLLGLNGFALTDEPDLPLIQITALLTLYLKSVGHINRAWITIGISIRHAHALGMHIRRKQSFVSRIDRESVIHTWWSLYCLESILSTILGRPIFNFDNYCSVPLPLPLEIEQLADEELASRYDERYSAASAYPDAPEARSTMTEYANAGSFLKSRVQICMIVQRALIEMYSGKGMVRTWSEMQQVMNVFSGQLEAWVSSLPLGLDFRKSNHDSTFQRQRLNLEMRYIGVKILITRPFLCRLDSRIANPSAALDEANKRTARTCVVSAKALTRLLPDGVDVVHLYHIGPWWTMVHSIMQALTVLLLELSYGISHGKESDPDILPCISKLMRWLRAMQHKERAAQRAYELVWSILVNLAPKVDTDISDIIREDAISRQLGDERPTTRSLDQLTGHDYSPTALNLPPYIDLESGQDSALSQQQGVLDATQLLSQDDSQTDFWFGSSFVNYDSAENPIPLEDDFSNVFSYPSSSQYRQ